MLTQHATGTDWISASQAEKTFYVTTACSACAKTPGLSEAVPELVLEGIDAVFAVPGTRGKKLSLVFGDIFTAQTLLGDYHGLVDSFRMGEEDRN